MDNHANYYGIMSKSGDKVWPGDDITDMARYFDPVVGIEGKFTKVSVNLNLKLKKISFEVDGVDKGVAFENIKCGEHIYYRLAVTLKEDGDKVILLNYEEIQPTESI